MAIGGGSGGGSSGAVRAGRAVVEILGDHSKLGRALSESKQMVARAGATIGIAGAGIAAAAGAVLGGIGTVAKAYLDRADAAKKAADRLGTTSDQVSALGYAADMSGASLADVETAVSKMYRTMTEAAAGGGEAADALSKLGTSAAALGGLPLGEQMAVISEGLMGIPSAAERSATAMAVLGKGALQLLPLLSGGAAGVRDLIKEAGDVGAVIDPATAASAEKIGDHIARAWTAIKTSLLSVGAAVIPFERGIAAAAAQVVELAGGIRSWIADNGDLVVGVAAGAVAVGAIGAAFVAVGGTLSVIAAAAGGFISAISTIGTVIGFVGPLLLSPFVAIPAAIAAAGVALLLFTDTGRGLMADLWQGIQDTFADTIGNLTAGWGQVTAAFGRGDIKTAFAVAVGGIKVEWARGVAWLTDYWNKFKGLFLDGVREMVEKFTDIWAAGVHGTGNLLIWLMEKLPASAGGISAERAAEIRQTLAEDESREQRERVRQRIEDAAKREKDRTMDKNAADADLAAAVAAQAMLIQTAKISAVFAALRTKADGGPGSNLPKSVVAAGQLAVRSGFAGTLDARSFGGSGLTAQLKAADKTNEELKTANQSLAEIAAAVRKGGHGVLFEGGT